MSFAIVKNADQIKHPLSADGYFESDNEGQFLNSTRSIMVMYTCRPLCYVLASS